VGKVDILILFLTLMGGNDFSCSPFSVMLAMCLLYIAFIMLSNIPFISFPQCFYHERELNFVRGFFFAYIDLIVWFSSIIYLVFLFFVLVCWVGVQCGIYKNSYNMSYLN
jgi:phosphatidylserine synthase